jgi:serine/threonine protein kinase
MFQVTNYTPLIQFSTVGKNLFCLAINETTREMVVIKEPGNPHSRQTVAEADILKIISHPAIIQLKDVIMTENGPALILPFYPHGDLLNQINKHESLPECDVKVIIFRILTALSYLHENGIAHRDIKLENIFLASENYTDVILADFGFASVIPEEGFCNRLGTPQYLAPEIWNFSINRYSQKVDIWSLGVTMYILLTGLVPYLFEDCITPLESISEAVLNLSENEALDHVSPLGREFLSSLLVIDPDQRISADDALKHEWFQFHDFHYHVYSQFAEFNDYD